MDAIGPRSEQGMGERYAVGRADDRVDFDQEQVVLLGLETRTTGIQA